MKHHPSMRRALLVLALGLAALPTWADDDCDAPVERWQSREAVRQMAAQKGWQIQRLKIKQHDKERSRKRDRDQENAAPQTRQPQPGGAAAPSPLFTPGTAPRGQIE